MTRVLTGIKPTGNIHLGNYVGAIRPALQRAETASESFFFMADIHALNQVQDPELYRKWTYSVAASWLCSGLNPDINHFYRQSDIPEVFELATILTTITPKGWMNKAHAYKAALDKNREAGNDDDVDVNMGLYTYPILMAADILIFDTTCAIFLLISPVLSSYMRLENISLTHFTIQQSNKISVYFICFE